MHARHGRTPFANALKALARATWPCLSTVVSSLRLSLKTSHASVGGEPRLRVSRDVASRGFSLIPLQSFRFRATLSEFLHASWQRIGISASRTVRGAVVHNYASAVDQAMRRLESTEVDMAHDVDDCRA